MRYNLRAVRCTDAPYVTRLISFGTCLHLCNHRNKTESRHLCPPESPPGPPVHAGVPHGAPARFPSPRTRPVCSRARWSHAVPAAVLTSGFSSRAAAEGRGQAPPSRSAVPSEGRACRDPCPHRRAFGSHPDAVIGMTSLCVLLHRALTFDTRFRFFR